MELTKRDKEVLDYIREYMLKNGVTPTIREIGEGACFSSTSTIQRHMEKLVNLGYIERVGVGNFRYKVKGMKYTWDKQE